MAPFGCSFYPDLLESQSMWLCVLFFGFCCFMFFWLFFSISKPFEVLLISLMGKVRLNECLFGGIPILLLFQKNFWGKMPSLCLSQTLDQMFVFVMQSKK